MRHITLPILGTFIGALAFAAPAAAQIVNGHNDVNNPLPEAPLGTKDGGSQASMQAPGEAQAAAGAIKNNAEAKNMQPLPANPDRDVTISRSDSQSDTKTDKQGDGY
jgi:hypothetical protein